jgi:hypothetical protein
MDLAGTELQFLRRPCAAGRCRNSASRCRPRLWAGTTVRLAIFVTLSPDWRDLELSLGGYAGLAIGARYGLEVRIAGLVFGLDVMRPGIKLPGFGRIGV